MRKIWTIAWKDVSTTFRDRNLVLIMLAAPLAVATIIALAFGGLSNDIPIKDIPVAIVNLDKGANSQNLGDIYVTTFIPSAAGSGATAGGAACPSANTSTANNDSSTLQTLVKATQLTDAAAAKAGVDNGTYTAAIIIPEDFTQKVSIGVGKLTIEPSSVELYVNQGHEIEDGIIRSVVESITNQIATGNIAVQSLIASVTAKFGLAQFVSLVSSSAFSQNIACAFTPGMSRLTIDQQSISVQGQKGSGAIPLLILFGSAQAMFFTLFTGQGGVNGIFEERKQGTLQRLVVTPTPRMFILIGKMVGVLVNCTLQLVFLFIALTIVGSILNKGFVVIWGTNYLLIGLVILAAALSATGLGALLAGVAKTPEQGQIYGSLINVAMAVLGGAFGFQLPEIVSRFSLLYWGAGAFQKLANGSTDVGLNLVVLVAMGVVMFVIGFWLFNKRLDV